MQRSFQSSEITILEHLRYQVVFIKNTNGGLTPVIIHLYFFSHNLFSAQFLKQDGSLKLEGDVVQSVKLAETLMKISLEGVESFYTGDMADDIANETQQAGIVCEQPMN